MKITLIEPQPPSLHVFSDIKLPRLGLPLLGAVLARLGHDVRIFVEDFAPVNMKRVLESDLVGFSTTTSTVPAAYEMADQIRRERKDIPIVFGGSHVTFLPEEALEHSDYCVRGEGEHTVAELVGSLESGSGPEGIQGLSYKKDGTVFHNPDRPLEKDLDSLPFPDFTLVEGHEKMRITPIATSRGCPYNCRFCSVIQMFGRKYRIRDVDNVIDEINEKQPKRIFFYDDNFTADRHRTIKMLQGFIDKCPKFLWSAQVRAEVARDEEVLKLMYKSGCRIVYIGFESINQETLAAYNKKLDVSEIVSSIKTIHKHGIRIHGMFVIGADEDNEETAKSTVDFAMKNKIDTIQLMILTPLPGTPYFDDLVRDDRIISSDWSLYDAHHVVYQPKQMSPYWLQKETLKHMKRFYSLKNCVRQVCHFDMANFYFRFMGYKILFNWHRSAFNRNFMKKLRKEVAY